MSFSPARTDLALKLLSDKIEKLAMSKLVVDLDAKIEVLIMAKDLKRKRG
jgi:hypothetical protein